MWYKTPLAKMIKRLGGCFEKRGEIAAKKTDAVQPENFLRDQAF
jgi:hypothetical protein